MKKLVESFQTFTQFMQQAQVAQSGNPYWYGLNPRKKTKSQSKTKKPKK
jgi:hypothetical protein